MKKILFLFFLSLMFVSCKSANENNITFLQWNIWQEGTIVDGGFEAIINEIERLEPDFVAFSEVRNYNGTRFCDRITDALAERGLRYYSFKSDDSGLLSHYPIKDSTVVYPLNNDHGSVYRLVAEKDGREFAVYTSHMDYLNCAYYDVRGYDGNTWKEREIPTSANEILIMNNLSERDEEAVAFIKMAQNDIKAGRIVLIGGDFNEPSYIDWDENTKDLYDHQGLVIPWTVSKLLIEAGYCDAYRVVYPDVLKNPGFTYPSDNKDISVSKLTWAPKADERERIDFIYYYPSGIKPVKAQIFGPKNCIKKSQRIYEDSNDEFIEPLGIWPTDHKGVFVEFELL